MDEVLHWLLPLAIQLSDSRAATVWRAAWQNIAQDAAAIRSAGLPADDTRLNLIESLIHLRSPYSGGFDYHPVLYVHFLQRVTRLPNSAIQAVLSSWPQLAAHYQALDECLRAVTLIIGAIRRLGAGYPHTNIVYTAPMKLWSSLERVCEVPWPETSASVPSDSTSNLQDLGLGKAFGADAPLIVERLEELLTALRRTVEVQALNNAYGQVIQNGQLGQLAQARTEFGAKYAELRQRGLQGDELSVQAFALSLELYFIRKDPIRNYVTAFERFEKLVQRIYWLLSQLIFHQMISCISTGNFRQLQQALVFHEEEVYLTALAPTYAKTLRTGQLIHITMPELAGNYDGIYQIRRWNLDWDVQTGARIFVKAEPRWQVRYDAITTTISSVGPVFVPSEEESLDKFIDSFSFSLPNSDGFESFIRLRDMSPTFTMDESFGYPE